MSMDRRHDDHPEPPDGVERRCSDDQCRAAREEWFTATLLPRLMNRIYAMIASTVLALSGMFLYLSQNAIRDFELRVKDTYERIETHDTDIRRLEQKFDAFEISVLQRLDRNLVEIQKIASFHQGREK